MVGAFVIANLVGQVTPPKLTFRDGAFVVAGAAGVENVSLKQPSEAKSAIDVSKGRFLLKVGSATVWFDSKGLALNEGKRKSVTRLTSVPTSGKIATKESNAELMDLVARKDRSLAVSALSGYEMVDRTLYLLARWEDKDKKPWLEALVKIDTSQSPMRTELVGKLPGRSFGQGVVDDVLFQRGKNLAVLANSEDSFGIARMPLDGSPPVFEPYGDAVGKAKLTEDGASAWTLTPTAYGTNIVGIADLDQSSYNVVSEFRGKMTSIEGASFALYKVGTKQRLINLKTGAITEIESSSGLKPTSNGLLVYSPVREPVKAQLMDSHFRRLAEWTAPAELLSSRAGTKRSPALTSSAPEKKVAKPAPVKKTASAKEPTNKLTKKNRETSVSPKTATKKIVAHKTETKKPISKKRTVPKIEVEVHSRPSKKKD